MTQDKISNSESVVIGNIVKYSNALTSVTTAILGFTFILYIVGFIIVNTYLASYGIREFELLKPLYINASVGYVLYMFFSYIMPIYVFSNLAKSGHSRSAWAYIFLFLLISFTMPMVALSILVNGFTHHQQLAIPNLEVLKIGGWLIGFTVSAIVMTLIFILPGILNPGERHETKDITEIRKRQFDKITSPLITFPLLLFFIAGSLSEWGIKIYPVIKPEYGGGNPVKVQLVFVDDKASTNWVAIGGNINGNVSESVFILSENDKSVTLLLPNYQAVKLDRQLIKMILYHTPKAVPKFP